METVPLTSSENALTDQLLGERKNDLRIVLCSPANQGSSTRNAASLGIRSLSSFIPPELAEVLVVDSHCWGWDAVKTAEKIKQFDPHIIGIQLIFHKQLSGFSQLVDIAYGLGLDSCLWLAGGHVPTFSANEILNKFSILSCVIRGEGEIPLSLFLQSGYIQNRDASILESLPNISFLKDGKLIETSTTNLISDLDILPFPIFLDQDRSFYGPASVIGSRGCYATCEYCSVPAFSKTATGPTWRLRSAENIVDEIEILVKSHGQTHISFLDDIFLGTDNRSQLRAKEIARLLLDKNISIKYSIECRSDSVSYELFSLLQKSGLERVFLGLESGSETVLKRFKKMSGVDENRKALEVLQELGISVGVGFIMFDPATSLTELKQNLDFLLGYGLLSKRAISNKMRAYPGTPVHNRLGKQKRLFGDPLYPDYAFECRNVEKFYNFVLKYMNVFDYIDVWLLKREYESAGNKILYNNYIDYRQSYSTDIYNICTEFLADLNDERINLDKYNTMISTIKQKWDNITNG